MSYQLIKRLLDPLGYPAAQVVLPKKMRVDLPDTFLVYSQIASTPESFYSDRSQTENRRYRVSIYARNGNLLPVIAESVRSVMRTDFLYINESPDLEHMATGHMSRAIDFRIYEQKRG